MTIPDHSTTRPEPGAAAAADADRALKAKHRAMWASGDYAVLATEIIPDLGRILVEASHVRPGDRVLDVAAGAGNVAIPAALAGARVVASDLSPELMAAGANFAAERGAEVEWQEGDAEALPFGDGEFDVVLSCVGVMFAPHHQASADELIRVCRPGGTIGLINWTPSGFVGQLFATMKPYAAPPPPGAQPPPQWGSADHVRELFGQRVGDFTATTHTVTIRYPTGEAFRDDFKARYGPTIAAYRYISDDPERTAALDRELADLARRFDRGAPDGPVVMEWEYLLVTAHPAS